MSTRGRSFKRSRTAGPNAEIAAPRGLAAAHLTISGEDLVVLSYPTGGAPDLSLLTPAERHVAALVIAGLSNRAIAVRRSTCPRTVANQVASLFRKLGVGSRAELAVIGLG